MGGGNGQKAKMAREKNAEKNKPSKGIGHSLIFSSISGSADQLRSVDFWFFLLYFKLFLSDLCNWYREPVGDEQEGLDHPGFFFNYLVQLLIWSCGFYSYSTTEWDIFCRVHWSPEKLLFGWEFYATKLEPTSF
jgi:hypothetical protein